MYVKLAKDYSLLIFSHKVGVRLRLFTPSTRFIQTIDYKLWLVVYCLQEGLRDLLLLTLNILKYSNLIYKYALLHDEMRCWNSFLV